MKTTMRRALCLLLVLCMMASVPVSAHAATSLPDSIYLTQEGYSTCTLCAAAMLLRARMYLNGNSQWSTISESGIRSVAWISGTGLRWKFTYELGGDSVTVSYASAAGMSVETLKSILDQHPEGIVLYCGNLPHAVFATDYEGDTFYCAEPVSGYSGKRITLAESWLGHEYGSQAAILSNVTAYWYVSEHSGSGSGTETPACTCSAEHAGTYICTAGDSLNIRSGHGTGYSVIGSIPAGAEVTVTMASGSGSTDWAHVVYDGISGYVSMGYLEKQETALAITKQPEDVTAELGATVSMSVEAVGDGLTYQWQWRSGSGGTWNNTTVSGNTTDTITMEATSGRNNCQYRCVITDRYGSTAASEPATLTVEDCGCSADYAGTYVCTVSAGSVLNIRSGHGTGYSVLGSIPSGAEVTVTSAGGTAGTDWAHVIYDGISGYVSMGYLEKKEAAARNGWVWEDGLWFYYKNDVRQTGWLKSGGYWYYLDSEGVMQTGWEKVGGCWYYMNKSGVMQTGWVKVNGYWYYLADSGAMQTGWVKVNGKWYYLASGGAMQTGWLKNGGYWYYLGEDGAMLIGTHTIDGKTYTFNSHGVWIG